MKIKININDWENSYLFESIKHITKVDDEIFVDIDIKDYEYLCREEIKLYQYEDWEYIKAKYWDACRTLFND